MDKKIDGTAFRKMFIAGGKLLDINKNQINALNVFPVPDGDTGTNMSLTILSAVREIVSCQTNEVEVLSEALTIGALRGARGNSGVILSQILRGFCSVIKDVAEIDPKVFARGLKSGTDVAYSAVSRPREGTMLTVIRSISDKAVALSRRKITFDEFFTALIETGEETLAKTPEMLDVLKKAGVVDAGGFGLIVLFKGFLKSILGEEIIGSETVDITAPKKSSADNYDHISVNLETLDDIKFAYCTEFFITQIYKKTTLSDIERLKEKLNNIGDSVIAVGDLELIKVHVHTNKPGVVLQYALDLGELDNLKIENMLQQNRELRAKIESERKNVGLLAICSGTGLAAIFKDLSVDMVIDGGQTMNSSADEIAQAANRINAETVIVLPNNKNIILAAEQAKNLVSGKKLKIIPTKNVPQGLAAALAFNPEGSVEENLKNMRESIPNIKAGQVTYAVRSTNIDGLRLKEGDIIGLNSSKILNKGSDIASVTGELIEKMKDEKDEIITLYYGKDVKKEDAEDFAETLRSKYPECEIDIHCGLQPIYYYLVSLE